MKLRITLPQEPKRIYPYFARHINDGDVLYVVTAPNQAFRFRGGEYVADAWKNVQEIPEHYIIPLPVGTVITIADNN